MAQKRYHSSGSTKKSTKRQSKSINMEGKASHIRPSRAKYVCNPKLQQLFDTINLVPPDYELKSIGEFLGGDREIPRIGFPEYKEWELRLASAFITYLKTFPPIISSHFLSAENFQSKYEAYQASIEIYEQTFDSEAKANRDALESTMLQAFRTVERIYTKFINVRTTLYRLAEIGENPEPYLGRKLEGVVIGMGLELLIEHAYLDKDGILRRSPNPFAEIIEGVEISRIRACLICRKLYWATRKDKRCCSEEHSRIIRQRQVRENQKLNKGIYGRGTRKRKAPESEHYEDSHWNLEKDNPNP